MTLLGTHYLLTVRRSERERVRSFYRDLLGCELHDHNHHVIKNIPENVDLFHFPQKEVVGVEYVGNDVQVADRAEHRRCIWLELLVDDVEDMKQKLLAFGVEEIKDFWDKSHFYFHAPAGQIFRVTGKGEGSA